MKSVDPSETIVTRFAGGNVLLSLCKAAPLNLRSAIEHGPLSPWAAAIPALRDWRELGFEELPSTSGPGLEDGFSEASQKQNSWAADMRPVDSRHWALLSDGRRRFSSALRGRAAPLMEIIA